MSAAAASAMAVMALAFLSGAGQPDRSTAARLAGSDATLYVSPSGSNAGNCGLAAPCASFDRAYHVAQPGQIVQVAAGSYPLQRMTFDATKSSATGNVTFQSAPGQLAIVAGISGDGISHVTFVGSSTRNLAPPTSGITLKPQPAAMDAGGDFELQNCSRFVVLRNMDMRQFGVNGSDNVTIDGGTVGGYDNSGGDSFVGGPYQGRGTSYCTAENPSNVLITHLLFHDVQRTNFPTAHPDCLQFYGTASTVVDGNVFVRCGTSDLLARPNAPYTIDSLTIQNNVFSPSSESGGAIMVLGSRTDACGRIVVAYNTSFADALSAFDCGSYQSLEVVGNYQNSLTQFACGWILGKATVYAFNVVGFAGAKSAAHCGTSATLSGDPKFVNEAQLDASLQRGSPLIGRGDPDAHPATDRNGRRRPIRGAPDAGAFEWDVVDIVPGVSIGAVKIGMPRAAVESFYGLPSSSKSVRVSGPAPAVSKLLVVRYIVHHGALSVYYSAAGKVVGVGTTSPYYSTANGLGVGAQVADYPEVKGLAWATCRLARFKKRESRILYYGLSGGKPTGTKVVSVAFLPPNVPPCK